MLLDSNGLSCLFKSPINFSRSLCHCEKGFSPTKQSPEVHKERLYFISGDSFVVAAQLLAMTL